MKFLRCFACLPIIFVASVLAQEPVVKETRAQQCMQYGSYEQSEGIWEACEYEEMESNNAAAEAQVDEYQSESAEDQDQ
jgi:hypothetical protein